MTNKKFNETHTFWSNNSAFRNLKKRNLKNWQGIMQKHFLTALFTPAKIRKELNTY